MHYFRTKGKKGHPTLQIPDIAPKPSFAISPEVAIYFKAFYTIKLFESTDLYKPGAANPCSEPKKLLLVGVKHLPKTKRRK